MKLDLIRKMNESLREKDEFEKALDESGIEFDMGDGESAELDDAQNTPEWGDEESDYDDFEDPRDAEMTGGDMDDFDGGMDLDSDVERIVAQYSGQETDVSGQGTAEEMDDDELRDSIGDDLEQLGHSPEDISTGIESAMAALGRSEDEGQFESVKSKKNKSV